jgi:hypothetical protein
MPPVIPLLLDDCRRAFEGWGKDGILDPFERVYEVRQLPGIAPLIKV